MKKKEYIEVFFDGYFSRVDLPFGSSYISQLEAVEKLAKKNWKEYKNSKL
jgi:hypothetical protein